jgi:hypothetical protein
MAEAGGVEGMVGAAVGVGLAVVAGWQTTTLNVNLTQLSERDQVVVRGAFGWWASVTNIRFSFVTSDGPKTITVGWTPKEEWEMDGQLAHAHWPEFVKPPWIGAGTDERNGWLAGDVHLHWKHREMLENNPDLVFWIVLHEIGHSLGLSHLECGEGQQLLMCPVVWPEWSREDYEPLWEEYGWPDGRKGREENGRK